MLRPGGRTAYLTIVVSPGLSKSQRRIAVRLGPRAITSTRPLDVLMEAAGFGDVSVTDVTEEFLETARAWQSESFSHEEELRVTLGDEFDERAVDRADLIRGVRDGMLRRVLVTGALRNQ
jgi:hypothetical protein